MDFFKSTASRLLSNKNSDGLCRELTVTKEQAERIYSEYHCNFPVTEITATALLGNTQRSCSNETVATNVNPSSDL